MNRQQTPGENSATYLAVFGLLLLAGSFIFLAALVMPTILGLVIVVAGFVGFVAMHYLIWGWWLTGKRPDDEDELEQ